MPQAPISPLSPARWRFPSEPLPAIASIIGFGFGEVLATTAGADFRGVRTSVVRQWTKHPVARRFGSRRARPVNGQTRGLLRRRSSGLLPSNLSRVAESSSGSQGGGGCRLGRSLVPTHIMNIYSYICKKMHAHYAWHENRIGVRASYIMARSGFQNSQLRSRDWKRFGLDKPVILQGFLGRAPP
jgi:hypothetical protein